MKSWLACLLLGAQLCLSPALANPCALPGGMGGTGIDGDGSGMGGTGLGGSGVGGTGHRGDGSGMGGTGHRGEGTGMGGTGRAADGSGMGGTGVVGVITGFGSICVNGLELHYDGQTQVDVDGETATARALAIGHVVSAWASGRGTSLYAHRVAVNSAVVGPVDWVSDDGRGLVALGQRVRLPAVADAGGYRPRVGDWVRVSGLREANGEVRATLLERVSELVRPSVNGTVDLAVGNLARVGGLLVRGLGPVRAGDRVRAAGAIEQGVLRAERVKPEPMLAPVQGVERLSLQGVLQADVRADSLSLGYVSLAVRPGAARAEGLAPGQVVHVEARVRPDGTLEAERIHRPRAEERPEHGGARTGAGQSARQPASPEAAAGPDRRHREEEQRRDPRRVEIEKVEIEKVEIEKVEIEKVEIEKVEVEKVEVEKVEVEKVEVEKVEVEKVEVEKVEVEKVEVEKVEVEKVEVEKPEVEERHERH